MASKDDDKPQGGAQPPVAAKGRSAAKISPPAPPGHFAPPVPATFRNASARLGEAVTHTYWRFNNGKDIGRRFAEFDAGILAAHAERVAALEKAGIVPATPAATPEAEARQAYDYEYSMAACAARRDSALAWLNENEPAFCAHYITLTSALAARDLPAVKKSVRELGDLAPYYGGLPCYDGNGRSETIGAAIARLFPERNGAALRKALPPEGGALPPRVYARYHATAYLGPVKQPSGAYGPMTADMALVLAQFNLLALEKTVAAAIDEREKTLRQRMTLSRIVPQAILAGDGETARKAVAEAAEAGTLADILRAAQNNLTPAPTEDGEKQNKKSGLNFTMAVLAHIDEPQACFAIYKTLVDAGQPMAMQSVIERAVRRPGSIEPAMLAWCFDRIYGGNPEPRDAAEMLRWLYQGGDGKPSLIEQAATQPELFRVLTRPFGHFFEQARALNKLAARHENESQDDTLPALLRRHAQHMVGHENFIKLSPHMVINPRNMPVLMKDNMAGIEMMTKSGNNWCWHGQKATVNAAFDYIKSYPGFVLLGDHALVRLDLVDAITTREVANKIGPQLTLSTEKGDVLIDEKTTRIAAFMQHVAGMPGWEADKRQKFTAFKGTAPAIPATAPLAQKFNESSAKLPTTAADVENTDSFGRLVNNLDRIWSVWCENGHVNFAIGAQLHRMPADDELLAALRTTLNAQPGFVALTDNEWAAPARLESIGFETYQNESGQNECRITMYCAGRLQLVSYADIVSSYQIYHKLQKTAGDYIFLGDKGHVRAGIVSAVEDRGDSLAVYTPSQIIESTLTGKAKHDIRLKLEKNHGFVTLGAHLYNPAHLEFAYRNSQDEMWVHAGGHQHHLRDFGPTAAEQWIDRLVATHAPAEPSAYPAGEIAPPAPANFRKSTEKWHKQVVDTYFTDIYVKARKGPRPGY